MHAWTDADPLRLVAQPVPATDPTGKAMACYGGYLPAGNDMRLRFVAGRPVSAVTCVFLGWLLAHLADQGNRALVMIWDNASWHRSAEVRQWIRAHNRQVKQHGGCRLMVCYLPVQSPWLNAIEPKWVHGKRAVAEPARLLPMTELTERICTYYQGELIEPLAQPAC